MKKALFALSFCFITAVSAWSLKSGTYAVTGTNPSGGTYQGQLLITPQGDNYKVIWQVGSRQIQTGIGVYRSWEGVFSVAYTDLVNGGMGIVAYKVGAWGDLDGTWSGFDGTRQGTEQLAWQSY